MKLLFDQNISFRVTKKLQILISNQETIETFLHDQEFSELACLELDK